MGGGLSLNYKGDDDRNIPFGEECDLSPTSNKKLNSDVAVHANDTIHKCKTANPIRNRIECSSSIMKTDTHPNANAAMAIWWKFASNSASNIPVKTERQHSSH